MFTRAQAEAAAANIARQCGRRQLVVEELRSAHLAERFTVFPQALKPRADLFRAVALVDDVTGEVTEF